MNEELIAIIHNFENSGEILADGKRNKIKTFPYQGLTINVKSFKVPILINGIIYKYFRKSKAKRSYENAVILLDKGIGTPKPIAFHENFKGLFLKESYYISEHLNPDFVFKNVFEVVPRLNLEQMLRGIAKFTFELHQNGIEFLDHSPGNTLITVDSNGNYNYFLVDLNRMKFYKTMSLDQRLMNMRKLTPGKEMIRVISNEYAKLYGAPEEEVFEKMWQNSQDFYRKFTNKQAMKKKFMFWKK